MSKNIRLLAVLISLSLMAQVVSAQIFGGSVVGYYEFPFVAGANLFENGLESSSDTLTNLFSGGTPNGTTISLWNSTTSSFDTTSEYLDGAWTVDLTLAPGTGALLNAPTAFTNIFVGTVLNHDGTVYTTTPPLTPPPAFSGPNGTYLLGDETPIADTGADIYLNILGRLPNVGEQVRTLSGTSTYLGDGVWDNGVPTLGVGQAAFLTVESIPEPSVWSLFGLGVLFIGGRITRFL